MSRFGTVVEAVGAFAGFATKWQEIQLVTVGILTVGTDRFEVFVHGCEGLDLLRRRGSRRGRHNGWLD